MMRRLVALVLLVVVAGGAWWWMQSRTTQQAPSAPMAEPAPPPPSPLAMRIELVSAGPGDDMVIIVRAFDRHARQADAIQRASSGTPWRGRGLITPSGVATPPAGWHDQLVVRRADGRVIDVSERRLTPDGHAVLVIAAANLPEPGTALMAVLPQPSGETVSNRQTPPSAPTDAVLLQAMRARIAQWRTRWDAVASIGDALIVSHPASPWGHYLRGLAWEAAGDAVNARAAFQRALDRVTPGEEPPIGLIAR